MSRRPRRNHSATFKAKVALAAIQGEKTALLQTCRRGEGSQWFASCFRTGQTVL